MSHTPIELPLNQPKPLMEDKEKLTREKIERSNSVRDPLLQRQWVTETCRTPAKQSFIKTMSMDVETQKSNVQLGSRSANVSMSSGSHRAGGVGSIGQEGKGPETPCCPSNEEADVHLRPGQTLADRRPGGSAVDSSTPHTTGEAWRGGRREESRNQRMQRSNKQ